MGKPGKNEANCDVFLFLLFLHVSAVMTIKIAYQQLLRSSQSNQLIVPPVRLSTYGPRSFAVAGPNNLPEYLLDLEVNFRWTILCVS